MKNVALNSLLILTANYFSEATDDDDDDLPDPHNVIRYDWR